MATQQVPVSFLRAAIKETADHISPATKLLPDECNEVHQLDELSSKSENSFTPPSKRSPNDISRFQAWQEKVNRFWVYEVISCFISLLALGGLIAVLATYNGRKRLQWKDNLSLNTVVAVTTAVLKASLMLPIAEGISNLKWQWYTKSNRLIDIEAFDSASRGPWGSLLFLFSLRRLSLATFGAIITICALAIDPFSQQVIKYESCLRPFYAAEARIPKTSYYAAAGFVYNHLEGQHELDNMMTVSVYNGLIDPPRMLPP